MAGFLTTLSAFTLGTGALLNIYSPSGDLNTSALRPSDIPTGSEILSRMTSIPLAVFPDRQPGLFLRANLSCWKIHLHLPILEQFQQYADAIRAGQACIEDGFISCKRPGMDHNRCANF